MSVGIWVMLIEVYMVLFFWVYTICKKMRSESNENDWADVLLTIAFAIISPISLIFFAFMNRDKIKLVFKIPTDFSKPPKWL